MAKLKNPGLDPLNVVWVDIGSIQPNTENTNEHPPEQIDRLAEGLEYYGWKKPIIVWTKTNEITAGNGTYAAAKKLNMKQVPVSFQNFDSEEQAYAFHVFDNEIAKWSKTDRKKVNLKIPELGPAVRIEMLGFKEFTLDPSERPKLKKPVKCPNCEMEFIPE
jgi:hypothetical protein